MATGGLFEALSLHWPLRGTPHAVQHWLASHPSQPAVLDRESSQVSPPRTADTNRPVRSRRVLGNDGREWRVREVSYPLYDRRTSACLIFDTTDAARRVRDYPANWFELADEELFELSLKPYRPRCESRDD